MQNEINLRKTASCNPSRKIKMYIGTFQILRSPGNGNLLPLVDLMQHFQEAVRRRLTSAGSPIHIFGYTHSEALCYQL